MNILFDVLTTEFYIERFGRFAFSLGYLELFGMQPSFRGSLLALEVDWGQNTDHLFDGDLLYIRGIIRYFRDRNKLNG